MIDKLDYKRCTICQVCINICPKNCITLDSFKDGFNYPVIDKNICIDCKACEKTCPVLNPLNSRKSLKQCYAGMNTNEEERVKSSSGGVFSTLAKYIMNNNGVVCGAAFDKEFQVNHILIENENELIKLRGSKYIQSNTKDVFNKVKKQLTTGKTVLFSGCPCQVGGLKKYLGKEYENLYTIDFICHGIPSQNIFNKYLEILEKKYKSKVVQFFFRDKSKGWHTSSIKAKFENGKEYTKFITDDMYMRGYFGNIYLKSACYNCEFRNFKSESDITLGDFWGAEVEEKEIDDNKGLCAVVVNTSKGVILKNNINDSNIFKAVDYNKIVKYNKALEISFKYSTKRNDFLKLVRTEDYNNIFKKLCKEKNTHKFVRVMRYKLGKIKQFILKIESRRIDRI